MDLTELLEERSAEPAEGAAHHLRLAAVTARVVGRRRRRRAAVVAIGAAAAVLLVIGLTATLRPSAAPRPAGTTPTASPTRLIEGFPEYAQGARVVAAKAAAPPNRTVTVGFVPATLDLVFFDRCDGLPDQVAITVELTLNGRPFGTSTCGSGSQSSDLTKYGLAAGKPATFTATVRGATGFSSETGSETKVAVPAAGTFGVAVGERMPFSEYPLPPRPSTLRPLEPGLPVNSAGLEPSGSVVLRADPADPTRAQWLTLTWRTMERVELVSQTPGRLRVRVNSVEVTTGEWWDYQQSSFYSFPDVEWPSAPGLTVRPGDPVTIEVIPEHVTGDWRVVFVPKA
jgi:hypothetical protein